MILLALVLSLTIFLFSAFTLSYRLQTINRVIINTPIEIFELAIPLANIDETNIYFDKNKLESNVLTYYQDNLSELFKSYKVSFYYYNQENGSICVSEHCNAVEITVDGIYMWNFHYERSIEYEIHKGAKYGQ